MRLIQIWKVARCGCFGPLSVPMTGVASSNRNVRQCRRGIPATRQTDRPERHRQRSTALTRSMRAAERCCAAARAGSGVLGAWWVHIPEKLENSTKAKNAPRNGRKSAVPPNGSASRGRRKGSSTPAKFPQPSERVCRKRPAEDALPLFPRIHPFGGILESGGASVTPGVFLTWRNQRFLCRGFSL